MCALLADDNRLSDVVERAKKIYSDEFRAYAKNDFEQLRRVSIHNQAISHDVLVEEDLEPEVHERRSDKKYFMAKKNIEDAYKWLRRNKDEGLVEKLEETASRIDFEKGVTGMREKGRPRIKNSTIYPPRGRKLQRKEIPEYVEEAKELDRMVDKGKASPIEQAIYHHFKIAQLHPFDDANGRTARTYQNFLLTEEGFPPAIIKRGDKLAYHEKLDDAKYEHKKRSDRRKTIRERTDISDEEREFFNFLVDKINTTIDDIYDGHVSI